MSKYQTSHSVRNSLDEWLHYLETIHSTEIDLGLSRIRLVAQRLGLTFLDETKQSANFPFAKVITVAGTNGKGTTCAFLENALLAEKYTVAVYSSPHIEKFNERLRVNKVDVDDQLFIDAFEQIEQMRAEISLTYYEYTTLAAFLILQASKPDIIILEVGLGGRLDATNLVNADIAVITTIDLDHQSFLGDNRESIGFEKAGIMRKNQDAIIGDTDAPQSILSHGDSIRANMLVRNKDFFICNDANSSVEENKWQWHYKIKGAEKQLSDLCEPFIPKDNVATALTVLMRLGVTLTANKVNQIIEQTQVAGRTEMFKDHCDIMLDVAHNPQAARYLAGKIKEYRIQNQYNKVYAVISMLEDKDITNTLAEIIDQLDHCYIGQLKVQRAASIEKMTEKLASFNNSFNCFDNVTQAFKIAKQSASTDDLILVFGSFHTVAEIRRLLVV